MVKNRKSKIMLLIIVFLFLFILPNYSNAAKVSVGKVKGVKIKEQNTTSLKISWNSVNKVNGYKVYICDNSNNKFKYYGKTTGKSITIKKLKSSKEYKIKIRGYKTVKKKTYYGSYSSILKVATKPTQVKNLKVKSQTDTTVNLTWNKVSNATGYRVYKYNSSNKKYELYKDLKTNKLTINKLKSSEIYKFKVRAYKTIKKKNEYGIYSNVLTTATKPTEVKNIKIKSQNDTEISLEWDEITRATGYRIYVCNGLNNSYSYYGYSKTNSIVLSKLTPAMIYKIKVIAYKQFDSEVIFGFNSKEVLETFTKPNKVINFIEKENTLTSLKLSWDKMSDLAEYEIYMYNSSSKKYEYMDKTLNTSYEVLDLKYATGYKFRIRAYITINDKKYYGGYTDLQAGTLPNKVTGLKSTEQTETSITIQWDKLEEATGYAVYMFSDTSQSYKLHKTTKENNIIITNLDTARFYKIYVKSYVTIEGKTYYSDESIAISQKTLSTDNIKAGLDVSKHQGEIDWDKVKGQIDFAIIRLGWIGNKDNHTLDTYFERNYSECKRLGIPVGVYVYNYCNSFDTAKEAANWTVEKLKGKELDLPVFIDMEDSSIANLGKSKLSNICIGFNEIIAKAGYEPGIYANRNWFDNYLNKNLRNKYTCWIAHYTNTNQNYDEEFSIWQYTSKGLINGISGNVDLNIIYIEEKEVE